MRENEAGGLGQEEAMKEAISWCKANDVLKGFFETNPSARINMLMTEWNWDDAFAVQREEGREEGLVEGEMKGRMEGEMEVAKNALTEGLPVEVIQKITGLDTETIKSLAAQ